MEIILGTLNFDYDHVSERFDQSKINEFLTLSKSLGINTIDSAYYYGKAEKYLGDSDLMHLFKVNSKANPWFENDFSNGVLGQLNKKGIENQLSTSLSNLRLDSIYTYFMHCWDYQTPIEETLSTFDELYRKEKFKHFGVSNISPIQLDTILRVCEDGKYNLKVDFYQGMYNLYCRKIEELFDKFKEFNISFQCYNPLAGGLLTGKYAKLSDKSDNRFNNNEIYKSIFWNEKVVEGTKDLNADISLKWLTAESLLRENDSVIVGCSSTEHLKNNVKSLRNTIFTNAERDLVDKFYKDVALFQPNYFY